MEEKEKMALNSQCKEDFERWFLDKYGFDKWSDLNPCFYCLDNSLKYGVYVDFFVGNESKILVEYSLYDRKIRIIDFNNDIEEQIYTYDMIYEFEDSKDLKSDYENWIIKKANEIYNQNK
jgi:hypothetical protein